MAAEKDIGQIETELANTVIKLISHGIVTFFKSVIIILHVYIQNKE